MAEFAGSCPECGWQVPVDTVRFTRLKKIFSVRYDFVRLLGIGGFAEVYQGRDKLLEREVAIKILLPQHGQDPQTVERFLREAKLYAKLEHKNIIPIYDTGILEGHVFITMKYIRGESLKHALFAQKRIAPGLLPGIIRGVAQALSYIHRQGIVHRDIKPANILVEKASQAVYLADFGIARAESSQTLTQTGMIIGTPFYLSPEQIKGKKTDQRSDIYALGATLYELATGQPPFRGDSPLEILYQHVNENAGSLKKSVPDIDPLVEHIITKCIEKDPARRFQQADEIVALLEQAEGSQADGFEKTVLTATVRSRPKKARKILTGMALLATLVAAAYFIWFKDARPPAPAPIQQIVVSGQSGKPAAGNLANNGQMTGPARQETIPDQADTAPQKQASKQENPIAAPKSALAVEPRQVPAAGPGTIRFSSFPALADIYFKGEKIGSTEQVFERNFPAGEHLFTFTIPDYQSATVQVALASGATVSAHHRFPPFRSFTITARPFGRVFIDGREYGDTPQTIKLAFGEHLVKLVKSGYQSEERKIHIDQSTKNSVFFELTKEEQK